MRRPIERPHRMSLRLTKEAWDVVVRTVRQRKASGDRYVTQTDVVESAVMRCAELKDPQQAPVGAKPRLQRPRNGHAALEVPGAKAEAADIVALRDMITAMRKAGLSKDAVASVIAAYLEPTG
ncbi:MAG: hypothetical protein ACRD40_13830 [Candidatus Acidiferrales bacterium]